MSRHESINAMRTRLSFIGLFAIAALAPVLLGGCGKDEEDEPVPEPVSAPANSVTDADGTVYPTVTINGRRWMAENLRVSRYRNGDPIPTGLNNSEWSLTYQNSTGAYALFNDADSNDALLGKLYNGFAVLDARGLCPSGWHIPTDAEWSDLELHLGMPVTELDSTGTFRGVDANTSGQLRDTTRWSGMDTAATNSTGFTAIPAGYRFNSGPYMTGQSAIFWTSTVVPGGVFINYHRSMSEGSNGIWRAGITRMSGLSCRCIEDP